MKPSDDEIKAKAQEANKTGPQVGDICRHYKGGEYEVIARPLDEYTLEPLVIYRSLRHGTEWSRPLSVFTEVAEHDGRLVHRFEVIRKATDPENPTKAELASSVIDLWLSALEAMTHALAETGELIDKAAEVNHGSQLSEKWLTERYERLKAERKAGGAEDISG